MMSKNTNKVLNVTMLVALVCFFVIGYGIGHLPAELFSETGSVFAVVVISLPTLLGLIYHYGKSGFAAVIGLGIFALAIESIGIATGFPYSYFSYTQAFGYKLFELAPWTVFVAWSPLVIGAFVLSQSWQFLRSHIVTDGDHKSQNETMTFHFNWSSYVIYILLLVGIDLILDPGAVARGLWVYHGSTQWFNVPLFNFVGWIFSGTIAWFILWFFLKKQLLPKTPSTHLLVTSSYLLSLTLWIGVCFAYQLWVPGFVGMLLFALVMRSAYLFQKQKEK